MRAAQRFVRPGWPTIVPRLVVDDAKGLVDFLRRVFAGKGRYSEERPSEIRIGESVVMVTDTGIRTASTAFLYVYVGNTDAAFRRAIAAGARSIEPPSDMHYGDRRCMIEDRWGNTWQIATYRERDADVKTTSRANKKPIARKRARA